MPIKRAGELLIEAKTKGVPRADGDLKSLAKTAGQAEKNVGKFNASSKSAGKGADELAKNTDKATKSVKRISGEAFFTTTTILALGVGFLVMASNVKKASLSLSGAVEETSTLIEGTSAQVRQLNKDSVNLSSTFGGRAASQAQAYYAVYSAGAQNAAIATDAVVASNKLAIGGVAKLGAATKLLTGTLNAYSEFGLEASNVSDIFFEVVKNGITTIPALAQSFSTVSGVAANFGVSLEAAGSALAAITATGVVTPQAATQVRALLLSLQRLNDEQKEYARQLGVSSTAPKDFIQIIRQLRSGLSGLSSPTQRSSALFQIFGQEVEAFNGVLGLTGGGFETFERALVSTTNSLGATDEAFGKIAEGNGQRLAVVAGKIEATQIRIGDQLLKVQIPAMERYAEALGFVGDNLDLLAVVGATIAGVVLPSIIVGLVKLIPVVAAATGGLSLLGGALSALAVGSLVAYLDGNDDLTDALEELETAQKAVNKAIKEGEGINTEASKAAIANAEATLNLALKNFQLEEARIRQRLNLRQIDSTGHESGDFFIQGEERQKLQEDLFAIRNQILAIQEDVVGVGLPSGFTADVLLVNETLGTLGTTANNLKSELDKAFAVNDPVASNTKAYERLVSQIKFAIEAEQILLRIASNSLATAGAGLEFGLREEIKQRQEAIDGYREQLEDIGVSFADFQTRAEAAAKSNDKLNKTFIDSLIAQGAVKEGVIELTDAFAEQLEAENAVNKIEKQRIEFYKGEYTSAIEGVSDTIADSLLDATDSWEDFGNAIVEVARQTVANIISEFTSRALFDAISLATGGKGNGFFAGVGSGAVGAGAGAGAGAGVSGFFGGAGAGLAGTASGLTGAAAIGAVVAPIAALVAGVAAAGLVLHNLLDQGEAVDRANFNVGGDGLVRDATTTRTRRNNILRQLFGQGSHSSATANLGSDIVDAINNVLVATSDSVTAQATAVGATINSLASVQFRDLTDAQLANADYISRAYADTLASTISGVTDFARAGERASQTLARLAGSIESVNASASALGLAEFERSLRGAAGASDTITALGRANTDAGASAADIQKAGLESINRGFDGLFSFLSREEQNTQLGIIVENLLGFIPKAASEIGDAYAKAIADNNFEGVGSTVALLNPNNQAVFRALFASADNERDAGSANRITGTADVLYATAADRRVGEAINNNAKVETLQEEANRLLRVLVKQNIDGIDNNRKTARDVALFNKKKEVV